MTKIDWSDPPLIVILGGTFGVIALLSGVLSHVTSADLILVLLLGCFFGVAYLVRHA